MGEYENNMISIL